MKKYLFLLLTFSFWISSASAQDIKSLFLAMPDSITPLLSEINKADFLDFKASGMESKVQNKFYRTSIMNQLEEDLISIQMSEHTNWEMKILPYEDSYLIAIVETVNLPLKDSHLTLYTKDWTKLPSATFHPQYQIQDFISQDLLEKYQITADELKTLDMHSYYLHFEQNSPILRVNFTGLEDLTEKLKAKLSAAFVSEIKYKWKSGAFYLYK